MDSSTLASARHLIVGITSFAVRQADITAAFAARLPEHLRQGLPNWVWLELGALLQLRAWDEAGVTPVLRAELPHHEAAAVDLAARLHSPDSDCQPQLSAAVFRAWMMNCSQTAGFRHGVDIVLVGAVTDETIDALADFLWRHRPRR